ncbi:MAG TPA: hypothetical protein VE593_04195 [Nitrososphaeraceae archaeon]|nr:hypothetical protein [Nitrososphaeraceae archaeon]
MQSSESPRSTGVRCLLPSSPGLVKGDSILLDKCQELFCGTGMDMITVFTYVIINLLGTQLPYKMDFGTPFRSDDIGHGGQATRVWLPDF